MAASAPVRFPAGSRQWCTAWAHPPRWPPLSNGNITIDGTKNALQALVDGDLSYVIEYNPIFGKETAQAVKDYLDGKTVEKDIEIESKTFDAASAKEALDNNTRAY